MSNKFNYILNHFFTIYGINTPIDINYGIDSKSKVQIKASGTDFFNKKEPYPENIVWKEWKDKKIPFLFAGTDTDEIICISEGKAIINYDIVASSFYFLSGWQEYYNAKRDNFGRFPFVESIQYKLGIIELPVVNYYFDILKYAIEKTCDTELSVRHWGDKQFAAFISHDIDKCNSAWLEGSFYELKKGRLFSPLALVAKRIFGNDEWFNFDDILSIEKRYDVRSTFYFLCEPKKINQIPNADYNISDKKFQHVFDNILQNGSEIGIHGSTGTCRDAEKLNLEISNINRKISGNRFHFLDYDIKHTPRVIEQTDLKYDSTLGFAEHIGFRNSFCFPFFPYNIEDDKQYGFLEIPLLIMDNTLENPDYMGLSKEEALPRIRDIIGEVKKFRGCFTLLWHNNYFSECSRYAGWGEVFKHTLKYCSNEGANFMTGKDVYDIFVQPDI